jgi:hypothetical protein
MSSTLKIRSVVPATCLDHVDVVLGDEAGTEFQVRVEATVGRGIHAELQRLPSEWAVLIDVFNAVLRSHGSSFSHVIVCRGKDAPGAVIFLRDDEASGIRGLPPGVALLIAARLELPVHVVSAEAIHPEAVSDLPEPFRRFIEELPMEGLGGPSPGRLS